MAKNINEIIKLLNVARHYLYPEKYTLSIEQIQTKGYYLDQAITNIVNSAENVLKANYDIQNEQILIDFKQYCINYIQNVYINNTQFINNIDNLICEYLLIPVNNHIPIID